MNNDNINMTEQSVTAMAKSGGRLKAVELLKHGTTIEVTRTKSSQENVINWQDFAIKCGLSVGPAAEDSADVKASVVGYDSAGTAFSRVNIPAVDDREIESMVQLQAESRLPLPGDQMELAWRADKTSDGQLAITIAAARRQQVRHFVDRVIGFRPLKIFLDCEGIVKVWKEIFSGNEKDAIIINADTRNTQVCLVQKGQLINAVALDMGMEDLAEAESSQQMENIERFVQDTRSVVDLFGIDKSRQPAVYVLSDGTATYTDLASSLTDAGLQATLAKPQTSKFSARSKLSINDIFEYRLQIGLALMVIDSDGKELNLFRNLYKPLGDDDKKHWLYSPKISGAIAAAMLILFVGICYAIDVRKPALVQKVLDEQNVNLKELVDRQAVLTEVGKQRPDLLKLISFFTMDNAESTRGGSRRGPGGRGGVQLESFDFKKGKVVTITGTASDNDTLYTFEDQLKKKPGIKNLVRTLSQNRSTARSTSAPSTRGLVPGRTTNSNPRGTNMGSRGSTSNFGPDSVKFTIEFSYGSFSTSARATR